MTLSIEKASTGETPAGSRVSILTLDFQTDASGNATEISEKITGAVVRVVTNPDDTTPPTDLWDLAIEDSDGVDLLAGEGANQSATLSKQILPNPPPFIASPLTFKVTNGGASKKGKVKVYVI